MGQKVNPHGLRVGVIKEWDTQWYADKKHFADNLVEDNKIRTFIKKKYYKCSISRITITRLLTDSNAIVNVKIYSGSPAKLIGNKGENANQIKAEIEKIAKGKNVSVNIIAVKKPDLDAQLIAENIATQLENRVAHRRAMKQAITRAMKAGAMGVKTLVSGRLDGREIAGSEKYHEGSIPLQTLRADIDYGFAEAHTTFGIIGVKVWVYNGEVLGKAVSEEPKKQEGGNANVNA